MRDLLKFLKNYKLECICAPLFKALEASFELIVPLVVSYIIDSGIGMNNKSNIYRGCLFLIILALVGLLSSVTAQYFAAKAAIGFSTGLRKELFSHLLGFSKKQIDNATTSTMINRITSDVNLVQNGVNMFLRLFLRSPFVVFGCMIMAFTIDFKCALIFVIVILILGIVVGLIMRSNIPILKKVQTLLDEVMDVVRENILATRTIRAFTLEESQNEKFSYKNDNMNRVKRLSGVISSLLNPLTYICINGAIIFLIYICSIRVKIGILTIGSVVALYNYMSQILVELIKLANLVVTLNRALAGAGRISEIMSMEPEEIESVSSLDILNRNDNQWDGKMGPSIQFENVSLKYHKFSEDVLSDINFEIKGGEHIGIIGSTGSGKTSLLRLLIRMYEPYKGVITIGKKALMDYSLLEIRNKTAFAMQKSSLFNGDIRSNIKIGNENATDEEIIKALKTACAYDFVMSKEGLDTKVSEGGSNFSGGQKQRLSLTRALIKNSKLLILDDVTSALDYKTEKMLLENIDNLDYKPTVIISSQRISTVCKCDRIIVLDDGYIKGIGTHKGLLETCETYKEIYKATQR